MPGKVILYIASTLDGYIATSDGGIDWLTSYEGSDHGYEDLMERTGALAMGSGTYAIFDYIEEWPHPEQVTWVFTSKPIKSFEGADIRTVESAPADVIGEIFESAGDKDVWLVGGGVLVAQFLDAGLIDEVIHFIAPKSLGTGIPMFTEPVLNEFVVDDVKIWPSGMVELRYHPS